MNTRLLDPVERLSRVLMEENAALTALDLQRASEFLAEKNAACAALAGIPAASAALANIQVEPATARRLHELCTENRRLLARTLAVQQRLIGLVANAIAKADADGCYVASGRLNQNARATPVTFLARA